MSDASTEPLKRMIVLLVDDKPEMCLADTPDNYAEVQIDPRFSQYFRLFWVQNAAEARNLLSAFDVLNNTYPAELGLLSFPPDVLIFDYAMSNFGKYPRKREADSNITARLAARLRELGHSIAPLGKNESTSGPETDAALGRDRTGCYIGGTLARAFGAYPCGPVPSTAHLSKENTTKTDADFYEWLNAPFFLDMFKDRSNPNPTWDDWLARGVQAFRQRVKQLTGAGIIRLSLTDVQVLASNPSPDGQFRIYSRYGERVLPLKGVFADLLLCQPAVDGTVVEFKSIASEWASNLLQAMFRSIDEHVFNSARSFTKMYFEAGISSVRRDREELYYLATCNTLDADSNTFLHKLCRQFNLDFDTLRNAPDDMVVQNAQIVGLWRTACNNDTVARWVALMLTVRVAQRANLLAVSELWRRVAEDENYLNTMDGVIDYDELCNRFGKDMVDDAIEQGELDRRQDGNLEFRILRPIETEDIFEFLVPLPEHVNLTRQIQNGSVNHALRRLGHAEAGRGPLSLSITDVLNNRPYNGTNAFGLRPGERELLQMYADEVGFPQTLWPIWLR